MAEISIAVAFIGGLVSFVSPCMLPLIPGFLAYLAGTSLGESGGQARGRIFLNSLFFVLGFSAVFSALGILLNTVLGSAAYGVQTWLARIGGAIVIFFGFYLTGLVRLPFLEREHRFGMAGASPGYLTSFMFGSALAAGWTPCVGVALGSILGLAAAKPAMAFYLLASYSLGLGIPFLLAGLFTSQASGLIGGLMSRHAKLLERLNIIFGIILIALGVLAFTQSLNVLANFEMLNRWLLQQ